MDNKDKKLVVVLLCVALSMLISGYFFVPFVIHVWTYIANLAGEKDMVLATTLFIYFVMFASVGAALGIIINAYSARWCKCACDLGKKICRKSEKN